MSIDTHRAHLEALMRRGRELGDALANAPPNDAALAETRIWQRDCASTISHLSGGSKAHWLSRRFSEAFLVRSPAHEAIEQVAPKEIVDRVLTVLSEAASSLSRADGQ